MITVEHLHKSFGKTKALDGLSLEVPSGKVFGLIGPNGAGKTTTIRILSGLIRPDSGSVQLNGAGPDQYLKIRQLTGALIEQPGLYGKLTLREYLIFFSRLYNLERAQGRKRIQELLELMELKDRRDERLHGFSLGMKQKVALARILLHDPPILLLDEPTAGLDPLISKKVRDYLLGQNSSEKKTILVSTHNLDEASRVCDEIAIIRRGRIVERGSWEELRQRHASKGNVKIRLKELRREFVSAIEQLPGISEVQLDFKQKSICFLTRDPAETNPIAIASLAQAGVPIISVEIESMTLEQAYLKLIGPAD